MSVSTDTKTTMACDRKGCSIKATSHNNTFPLSDHFDLISIEWGGPFGEWSGHLCKRHADELRELIRHYVQLQEHER